MLAYIKKIILLFCITSFVSAGIGSLGIVETAHAQSSIYSDGVNWQKTLRLRGIIEQMDPFNETMLYNLTQKSSSEIEARANYIQFELVASGFWMALRDSLESAVRRGRVDAYTIRESTERGAQGIYNGGTRVTYEDLLDTLSVNLLGNTYDPTDNLTQIHDIQQGTDRLSWFIDDLLADAPTIGGIQRLVQDFSILTMFELEIVLHVDETGFVINPQSLLFGTALWDDAISYDPNNVLAGFRDDFDNGIGIYIDLTDDRTIAFLVESGVQFSGETNTIPFYDLMTLFHYDYKFYSESNNVIARAAFDFDHDAMELENTILNRYNDLTYTFMYGQPPSWWEDGGRGHFINGLFEISDELRMAQPDQNDNFELE